MDNEFSNFKQFMKRREEASLAWTQGNAEPLGKLVARHSSATFFGPNGGYTEGADDVASTYEKGAAMFDKGSDFRIEILQMAASNGIAYWVGLMRGKARLKGKSEPVPMNLRVTEIFRREDGEWKMVHRHADNL